MGWAHSVASAYRRRRFAWLFATLLLSVVAHPFFEAVAPSANPLEWLLALNLGAAVLGVELGRRGTWALVALAVVFVAARLVEAALHVQALLPVSQALWVVACLLAITLTVREALRSGRVDSERILAALDAYLLAALVFGAGYWILERVSPGSFGPESLGGLTRSSAVYLSLLSITTLGLGDIVPVSAPARALMSVEAVGGQMYLAVLVARLVSLYSSKEDSVPRGE